MEMSVLPKKRVAFADAGRGAEIIRAVLRFVEDIYDFEICQDQNADYVFHSCFGNDVLKYPGVRVFVTGENVSPNFNTSDYALAFDPLTFGDRYCRLPLFRLYPEAYASLIAPRRPADEILAGKEHFCAYVMSNTTDSDPARVRIFDLLSEYKEVRSGGKWRNNTGGPVADKILFQSSHKFVIAFENSSSPGYLTEKFAQAAQSDAVPIYWGDPDIASTFNQASFVNCHNYPSLEDAAEAVTALDRNDEAYRRMISQPWFPENREPAHLEKDVFTSFLRNILDQPLPEAFRRNRAVGESNPRGVFTKWPSHPTSARSHCSRQNSGGKNHETRTCLRNHRSGRLIHRRAAYRKRLRSPRPRAEI